MLYMLNIEHQNLNKNPGIRVCINVKTKYHKQILHAWYTFIDYYPTTLYEILNQYIASNQHLKIQENLNSYLLTCSTKTQN